MKQVTVTIPDGKVLVQNEEGGFDLVDEIDMEKDELIHDFEEALQQLYIQFEPRLKGKFSIRGTINYQAYYKKKPKQPAIHWVNDNSTFEVVKGEIDWND